MRRSVLSLLLLLLLPVSALAVPTSIGPSFNDELQAAGLHGLPFSWRSSDATLNLSDPRLTDAQRTAIQAVLEAHDPTKKALADVDVPGFIADLKATFTRAKLRQMMDAMMVLALERGKFADLKVDLDDALTAAKITVAEHTQIIGFGRSRNFPGW